MRFNSRVLCSSHSIFAYPIFCTSTLRKSQDWKDLLRSPGVSQKTWDFVLDFGCLRFWPLNSSPAQNPWLLLRPGGCVCVCFARSESECYPAAAKTISKAIRPELTDMVNLRQGHNRDVPAPGDTMTTQYLNLSSQNLM